MPNASTATMALSLQKLRERSVRPQCSWSRCGSLVTGVSRNWLVGFHSDDRMIGGSFQHHRSLEQNTGFVADLDGQGALSAGERHVSRRVGKRNQRSFFGRFEVWKILAGFISPNARRRRDSPKNSAAYGYESGGAGNVPASIASLLIQVQLSSAIHSLRGPTFRGAQACTLASPPIPLVFSGRFSAPTCCATRAGSIPAHLFPGP